MTPEERREAALIAKKEAKATIVTPIGEDLVSKAEWGIDPRTGDVYWRPKGTEAWKYGTDKAMWERRGRTHVFGTKADHVKQMEAHAIRKFEGQRGSLSFRRKKTKRDVAPVDDEVRSSPRINTALNQRKPEPEWHSEAVKKYKAGWADLKNAVGYLEDIKDKPQVRNDIRLAQQDLLDAVETSSTRMAHILEPVAKSPSQRRAAAKIIMLEDMIGRGSRPRGTDEEITEALQGVAKAQKDLKEAQSPEGIKLTARALANARRSLTMKMKPLDNPLGFTVPELQKAHDELVARATPEMLETIKRHRDDAWNMLVDGVKRGYLAESLLQRKGETYFAHHVITHGDALVEQLPTIPAVFREPFRGWSQHAVGSRKLIDFDYENAWRKHIIRTEIANKTDDFMGRNLKRLDVMPAADSAEYKKLFTDSSGRVTPPKELPYYTGEGGPVTTYNYKGEPHIVYRYQPFRWRNLPASRLHAMVQDSLLQPFNDPHLIPLRFGKYLQMARTPNQTLWNEMWNNYVTTWKATQIMAGGLSTRTVNTFGDFYQLYLEDLPAFLMTIPRAPKVLKAMFGNPTGELKEFQGLLKQHRITEGSTFFGPQAYKLRQLWREASPDQRFGMLAAHAVDIPNYIANALEVWPRVTKAYADFLRIKAGKPLKSKVYSIEGLSPHEQMGVLARNTFVDYDAVSDFHRKYLRMAALPFLTWFQRTFNYNAGYMLQNPLNAALKIGVPAAAMWWWNNVQNPDLERNVSPWVQRFMWHLTTNIPHPLNPETNTVIVFPTGTDMFAEVVQIPAMMERVGKWMRGDRRDPYNFQGWSTVASTLVKIGTTLGSRVMDLSPITQALESIWTNHDARTGKEVVDPDFLGDPDKEAYERAKYLAMKAIPVFDRILQQMEKDSKRPGGLATTTYGKLWESLVGHGVFNPAYGPLTGFAFPYDPKVGAINRLRDEEKPYDVMRRETGHGFMEAFGKALTGDKEALREYVRENRLGLALLGSEGLRARIRSPEQLQELAETLSQRAKTPEQREKYRVMAKKLDLIRRLQGLKESPKGPRTMSLMDELRRLKGQPPAPPEKSIAGEAGQR